MSKSQYIVVIGCGRLGSILASTLSRQGNSVVVVDPNEEAFAQLGGEFSGFTIVGDASELSALRATKVSQADCLLAVTNQDNVNLMVAQVAKVVFKVPKVLARVFNPARQNIYREFDIATVSPTQLSADALLQEI
ncbi:MAG: TrkA family potassium uptake protein [Cyanobacteriota bacterium]|nr:TrkA family potassium uptake protein [Cyanobacteriota bacterium]